MPQHYTQKPTSHSGLQCTTPSSSPPLPIPFWPFLLTPLLPNPLLPVLHLQLTLLLSKYTRHTPASGPCVGASLCLWHTLPQRLVGLTLSSLKLNYLECFCVGDVCSLPFIYLFDHLLVPVGTYTNVFYT